MRDVKRRMVVAEPEGYRANGPGPGFQNPVEDTPTGQLQDTAAQDGVGRQGVARHGGAVKQQNPVTLPGKQHRR